MKMVYDELNSEENGRVANNPDNISSIVTFSQALKYLNAFGAILGSMILSYEGLIIAEHFHQVYEKDRYAGYLLSLFKQVQHHGQAIVFKDIQEVILTNAQEHILLKNFKEFILAIFMVKGSLEMVKLRLGRLDETLERLAAV